MFQRLRGLWRGAPDAEGNAPAPRPDLIPVEMAWRDETRVPIPDWERMAAGEPEGDDEHRHLYWNSAAVAWLDAMAGTFGSGMVVRHSPDFLLLSALPERQAQLFLSFCQTVLRRVRRNLGGIADDSGYGRYVALVFPDDDAYYDYIAHYYPEGGEYAMSSGVFLSAGYGHFALPESGLEAMEPVIAHELTHSLLAHLPLPTWLNEGLAVNTEHALFPRLADPRAQPYRPEELATHHAAYWDAESIQAFWSGESFHRTDDGNRLSYDLAAKITALAANDDPAFRAFVVHAGSHDAGMAAAEHLGYPLANLIEAVLGEGSWQPLPGAWYQNSGTEAA